jgi:hypothetical protein
MKVLRKLFRLNFTPVHEFYIKFKLIQELASLTHLILFVCKSLRLLHTWYFTYTRACISYTPSTFRIQELTSLTHLVLFLYKSLRLLHTWYFSYTRACISYTPDTFRMQEFTSLTHLVLFVCKSLRLLHTWYFMCTRAWISYTLAQKSTSFILLIFLYRCLPLLYSGIQELNCLALLTFVVYQNLPPLYLCYCC